MKTIKYKYRVPITSFHGIARTTNDYHINEPLNFKAAHSIGYPRKHKPRYAGKVYGDINEVWILKISFGEGNEKVIWFETENEAWNTFDNILGFFNLTIDDL